MKRKLIATSCLALAGIAANWSLADDWYGFRGTGGNAFVPTAKLPESFTVAADDKPASNIAWRTEITGRAVSGPIVIKDRSSYRVYATSSSGIEGRWCEVVCMDGTTGKKYWSRKIKSTGRPYCHPTSANAAPTPCTDGEYVYAFFSSNDLVCYDRDGNLKWHRGLAFDNPKSGNDVGMSSSPVVVGGVVVVQSESQADSFACGIDAKTGATLWQVERPHKANWASPCVVRGHDGQTVVVLQSSQDLVAIDPRSGSEVWKLSEKCSSIPSTVSTGGRLFVPAGNLKAYDVPKGLEAPKLLWESPRIAPGNASVVVTDRAVLSVKGSVLAAADFDGKLLWQTRLGELGQVWSSPVVAGDRLYVFGSSGKCVTVDISGAEGKVVAQSELKEEVLGSPAIMGNALVVRSVSAVWSIGTN